MEEKDIILTDEEKGEQAAGNSGVYIHKFKKPFTWEGVTYDALTFNFEGLKGSDLEAVEEEMSAAGQYAISPEYSVIYILRLAARAAGVHSSVIENLPLHDANVIRGKTKTFLLRGE